jgi:hypothetical protein
MPPCCLHCLLRRCARGAGGDAGRAPRGGAQVGVQPYAVQVPAQLRAGAALDVLVPPLVPASAGGPGALKVRVAVPDALGPGRTLQLNLVTARLPPST